MNAIDFWDETVLNVSKHFKVTADFDFMLFVIGVQEKGSGMGQYSREEKWDLINLGKCTMFTLLGYLENIGADEDGWPKFKEIKKIKGFSPSYQKRLLKTAMIKYFQLNIC